MIPPEFAGIAILVIIRILALNKALRPQTARG